MANPSYKWLLQARSRIQDSLLELFDLVRANADRESLNRRKIEREAFGWLLGAAFSLWRAAFLSDAPANWSKNLKDAEYFLKTLLEDNVINFTQDKTARAWSGGYYLNSARFRLLEANKVLSKPLSKKSFSQLENWDADGKLGRQDDRDMQYECLDKLIKHLKKALQ